MNAVIIAIGDELISGKTVDSNSAYLAEQLARHGIRTVRHVTVGDDVEAIAEAIRDAAGRAEVVLATGGLGPTADDLTRQALAKVLGTELVLHEPSLAEIREFFRRRGRAMVDDNCIQAMFPAGSEPLVNRTGTAPGIAAKVARARVFITPGVPHEMRWMFQNVIAPRLGHSGEAILHEILHTFGAGESDVGRLIRDLMADRTGPIVVGTTVQAGMVSVRVYVRAAGAQAARGAADQTVAEVRRRLGPLVVGQGEQTMASVVGELLAGAAQTVATAESCTGGLLGEMLTSVPGSSRYYLGGIISYANDVKVAQLGVDAAVIAREGAVSEPVARAMAEGCRQRFATDWAVGVTGIAGPDGGSDEKPVGLVYIALAGPDTTHVHRHLFPGDRQIIRQRAALSALNHLRLALSGQ